MDRMPDIARATEEATKLLRMQANLDIWDIRWIKCDKDIIFDSIQHYCEITRSSMRKFIGYYGALRDGCTIYDPRNDIYIILYNYPLNMPDRISLPRLNWTVSHELGHVYLGHTEETATNELEADAFAAQFLMPEVSMCSMMWMFPEYTVDDVMKIFHVSRRAATRRIKTIKEHYEFLPGEASDYIWKKQNPQVFRHFRRKEEGEEFVI